MFQEARKLFQAPEVTDPEEIDVRCHFPTLFSGIATS